MKNKILILSVMKFKDKNDSSKECSRISFILADENNICDSKNFKGYSDLGFFYDSTIPFETLPVSIIGQVVDGVFVERSSSSNPFKKTTILSEVEFNGKTYKLC